MTHEANVRTDEARLEMRDEPMVFRAPEKMSHSMLVHQLREAEHKIAELERKLDFWEGPRVGRST